MFISTLGSIRHLLTKYYWIITDQRNTVL